MTTKIEQFAKEQFGIELTPAQLEIIAMISTGNKHIVIHHTPRAAGKTTANKVALAYLQDSLKAAPNG